MQVIYESSTEAKKHTEHNIKIQIKNAIDFPIRYLNLEIGVDKIDFSVCSFNSRLKMYATTIIVRKIPKIPNIYKFVLLDNNAKVIGSPKSSIPKNPKYTSIAGVKESNKLNKNIFEFFNLKNST